MDNKKLSPTWYPILGGVVAFAALSAYPVWHVLIAEQAVAQAEHDGRVAKVVVWYSPSSLNSYLGAYFPQLRKCGAWLKVRDRSGQILKSVAVAESTSCNLPADIQVNLLHWSSTRSEVGLIVNLDTSSGGTSHMGYTFPP